MFVNRKYEPLFRSDKRYLIVMGGRAAGRSTAASQLALARLRDPSYFRCAIMRFVLGDIRNSIFQDICDRVDEQELHEIVDVREHTLSFSFGKNTINGIGFRKSSGDQKSKMKSLSNYTTVIIEEADEVNEEDFMQLDDSLRTVKSNIQLILLFNPPDKNHWIIKRWFNLVESEVEGFFVPQLKESEKGNTEFIHTIYRDNIKNLNESTVSNFVRYKETRPDHYWNMVEGLVSEGVRGLIYKNWKPCTRETFNQLPFDQFYGLDFGFVSSETALVGLKTHNEKLWVDELIYETGMTNQMIAKRMEELGIDKSAVIYADSAEPKSIEELRLLGFDVRPAQKGPDSVRAGINKMLEYEVFYTEESQNLAVELANYRWAVDRNKEPLNVPVDAYNHLCDSVKYGLCTHLNQPFIGFA